MASFHLTIKNGKRGNAANHSAYIGREGKYAIDGDNDLQVRRHGNLPAWAKDQPKEFWKAADKYERSNGSAYTEYEMALPCELSAGQQVELVRAFGERIAANKPYEYAIHAPIAALGRVSQPHVHYMVSQRVCDGLPRSKEQHFKRHNSVHPELGGCKKDSGGKHRGEMAQMAEFIRGAWADLQNEHLQKHGHSARVDHRSYRARGLDKTPERHLGRARIKSMSAQDVAQIVQQR